jgi:YihY family inner membrane protein
MSTAAWVPVTRGELEGDEALETLRACGRRRLAWDSLQRFRAADGFSHARALAFQLVLTAVPAIIAVVGLAGATGAGTLRDVVAAALRDLAPGDAGGILTEALREGGSRRRGIAALAAGLAAALVAGTLTMAQLERAANRIYGIERDRPALRRYGLGFAGACSAGLLSAAALAALVAGDAARRAIGGDGALERTWEIARWPLAAVLVTVAVALLFQRVPRRRQPEASWLAVGAALAIALWLAFTAALVLALELSASLGSTYGALAGTIGGLLWAFLTSLALLLGLAFAAQLEAVRAGVPGPRAPDPTPVTADTVAP